MSASNLFWRARQCLCEARIQYKLTATRRLAADWEAGMLNTADAGPVDPALRPGQPPRPVLVGFTDTPRRGLGTTEGRAAFVHALAHIEFNAVNLGLDAVYRFRGMPQAFYTDWLRVAVDEARHFEMLAGRLRELGHEYGDFVAHDGLWQMAAQTADSLVARMALVPRLLEARGLDVTPRMITRLKSLNDLQTVAILQVILHEEIGHVAVGTRWYHYACREAGVDPEQEFYKLLKKHGKLPLPTPVNQAARLEAGFGRNELERLCSPPEKD